MPSPEPDDCPSPSSVDEETFARVFGGCDWAVMFILARGGATYARLRFNTGPGAKAREDIYDSVPSIGPDGTIYIGSYDHHVYALNPDGTERWMPESQDIVHYLKSTYG